MTEVEEYLQNAANRFSGTPIIVLRKTTQGLVYGELSVNTTDGLKEYHKLTEIGHANFIETMNNFGNPQRLGKSTDVPTPKNSTGHGGEQPNPELDDFEPVNLEYPSPTEPSWVSKPNQGDRVLLFSSMDVYGCFVNQNGLGNSFQLANWYDKLKHVLYVLLTPKAKANDVDAEPWIPAGQTN